MVASKMAAETREIRRVTVTLIMLFIVSIAGRKDTTLRDAIIVLLTKRRKTIPEMHPETSPETKSRISASCVFNRVW